MTKRLILVLFTFGLIATMFAAFFPPEQALAASGSCWFTTRTGPVNGTSGCGLPGDGDYGVNDIFTGRSNNGNGSALSGIGSKGEFINTILNRFNNGNDHNRIGAAFIMQVMRGDHGWPSNADRDDWEARMRSSSVTFSHVNNAFVRTTSWYDPGPKNAFFGSYTGAGRTRDLIRIKQGGDVKADIEILCGNMTGNHGVLEQLQFNNNGTSTVNKPTASPGDDVVFTHTVKNVDRDDMTGKLNAYADLSGSATQAHIKDCDVANGLNSGQKTTACSNTYKIPGGAKPGDKYCQNVNWNPNRTGDPGLSSTAPVCVTITGAARPLACNGGIVTAGSTPEPGEPFSIQLQVWDSSLPLYNGAADAPTAATLAQFSVRVTSVTGGALAGLSAGSSQLLSGDLRTSNPFTGITSAAPDAYTINWTLYKNGVEYFTGVNNDCSAPLSVAAKPYVRAYGGDVQAGVGPGSQGSNCSNDKARISSWNRGLADNFSGAGTNFGAQALDVITGFASAQQASGGIVNGTGLSFANTSANPAGDDYGGSFGDVLSCRDYTLGLTQHAYRSPGLIPVGEHDTDYVVGTDVYIKNDIRYALAGRNSIDDLPSYKLVVKGADIYINSNISELDGVYVAQPDGDKGGHIYTCASADPIDGSKGIAVTDKTANFFDTCNHQLKVYGSLIAKQAVLLRTYGTLKDSLTDGVTPHAAEGFYYSPEEWLSQQGTGQAKVQAITSLPPTL